MNRKVGNILKYGISIALAVVLLYCSFHGVGWADFLEGLRACRWEFVILSMLFGVLAFWLRALRWRELLLPIDRTTSRLTCFNAVNISYLVNIALPRVGEFVRCGYITAHSEKDSKDQGRHLASYDKVLGTAALERSVDVLAMFCILAIFLVFTWKRFGGFFSERIFGAFSGSISVGKIAILVAGVSAVVAAILCAILFADKWTPLRKISGFCKGVWSGFLSCLKMGGGVEVPCPDSRDMVLLLDDERHDSLGTSRNIPGLCQSRARLGRGHHPGHESDRRSVPDDSRKPFLDRPGAGRIRGVPLHSLLGDLLRLRHPGAVRDDLRDPLARVPGLEPDPVGRHLMDK